MPRIAVPRHPDRTGSSSHIRCWMRERAPGPPSEVAEEPVRRSVYVLVSIVLSKDFGYAIVIMRQTGRLLSAAYYASSETPL